MFCCLHHVQQHVGGVKHASWPGGSSTQCLGSEDSCPGMYGVWGSSAQTLTSVWGLQDHMRCSLDFCQTSATPARHLTSTLFSWQA